MTKLRKKTYFLSKKIGDKFGFDLPYFIENGFWVLLAQFVNMAMSMAMSIVFTRYLSKETFGEYQLVLSFVGLFAILSYSGLNTSILRSVAKGFDFSYVTAVKFSFRKTLIATPLFLALSAWYYFEGKHELAVVLIIAGLLFSSIQAHNKWISFLNAKEKFKETVKKQIIQATSLNSLLIISAILFSDNLILISSVYLLVTAAFNTYWHFQTKKTITTKKIDNDCIPYGKYMTKIGILGILVKHFDKIIVGFFNIELLAIYVIALKLFDIAKQLIKSFYSVSTPKFVKKNVKIESYKIVILLFIGILVSLLLYFVSEPLIVYFYTEDYIFSANIFQKIIFVLPLIFVTPLFSFKANAQKNKSLILKRSILPPLASITISALVFLVTKDLESFIISKIYTINILNFLILVPIFRNKS